MSGRIYLIHSFIFLLLFLCIASETAADYVDSKNRLASYYAQYPGAAWIQIWSDEFNGNNLNDSVWTRQVESPGRYNQELQTYTNSTENAYLDGNGNLVIKAIHIGKGLDSGDFTSARLNTAGKKLFTYGKIAMRAKLPFGKGVWPAFWMLGANCSEYPNGTVPWPYCGEIDVMEMIGGGINDQIFHGTLHYMDHQGRNPAPTYAFTMPSSPSNDFHIYDVEWTPRSITWMIDGLPYGTKLMGSDMEAFSKPFFIILNLAVGGTWPGNPDSSTKYPQYYIVDWVRAYTNSSS